MKVIHHFKREPNSSEKAVHSIYVISMVLLCLLWGQAIPVYSQADIVAMEYYIDLDPGHGNGTPITITSGSIIDLTNEIIEASGLSAGYHTLGIRAVNSDAVWGFTEKREFYIPPGTTTDPPLAALDALEYYIDDDPGFGNATSIPIAGSNEIDLPNEIIEASALAPGFHTIGFRARNTYGYWGLTEKREFYIPTLEWIEPPVADISSMEYFFDVDPGVGLATPITAAGNVVDLNEIIPQNLTPGYHTLHIRAQNTDGTWGIAESRKIYVKPTTGTTISYDIVKMEYYFDGEDPGVGNGIDLPILSGPLIDLDPVNLPTSQSLVDGDHTITVRAQNEDGIWGLAETSTFTVLDDCEQPIPAFSVNLACAGEQVNFVDESQLVDPSSANYRWYIDGNLVANTIGNIFYSFSTPGDHDVSLAISQGTICYDSIGTTINIKPKPIVTFSAERVELGTPTVFDIFEFNVDPAAVWEWDFDNDGVVDSNDKSAVTYTYPSVGTFLASVLVSDQLGCATLYQKSVTVDPVGPGDTPIVIFSADVVEVGNPTTFTVVYQANIDPLWTWSWDFDTDGIEDDNTAGNTTFTYPQSGAYTATLTIDDGGGNTYDFTTDVMVNTGGSGTTPVVVFNTNEVEEGNPTIFTVIYQANIDPSWVWSWDFDADGVTDDLTKGNTEFTYPLAGNYTATLTVDDGAGNAYVFTSEVVVYESVSGSPPLVVFSARTVTLTEETNYIIEYQENVQPEWDWSWDFDGDGLTDDTTKGNTSTTFSEAGEFVTTLTLTDQLNNDYTFSELVKVLPESVDIKVYNVVTFNGDGIYDFLEIENIEAVPANTVNIYDRAGSLVFQMNEYNNDQRVFRGLSNINGTRELPQGNYFYTIDKGDGSEKITGFLYLKR